MVLSAFIRCHSSQSLEWLQTSDRGWDAARANRVVAVCVLFQSPRSCQMHLAGSFWCSRARPASSASPHEAIVTRSGPRATCLQSGRWGNSSFRWRHSGFAGFWFRSADTAACIFRAPPSLDGMPLPSREILCRNFDARFRPTWTALLSNRKEPLNLFMSELLSQLNRGELRLKKDLVGVGVSNAA